MVQEKYRSSGRDNLFIPQFRFHERKSHALNFGSDSFSL